MRYEVWVGYENGAEAIVSVHETEKAAQGAASTYRNTNRHEVSKGFPPKAFWVVETL